MRQLADSRGAWIIGAAADDLALVAAGRFRRITGAFDGITALVRALKDHETATTGVALRPS